MTKVFFHYRDTQISFKKKEIKKLIAYLFQEEKVNLNRVDYIFCKDDFLVKINKEFLHHNILTDIITFNFSKKDLFIVGEIYISTDRVKENASKYKVSINDEFLRVVIHGALHLCGFNDKTKVDKNSMTRKENIYLSRISSD